MHIHVTLLKCRVSSWSECSHLALHSCLENSHRGAWWLQSMGSQGVGHDRATERSAALHSLYKTITARSTVVSKLNSKKCRSRDQEKNKSYVSFRSRSLSDGCGREVSFFVRHVLGHRLKSGGWEVCLWVAQSKVLMRQVQRLSLLPIRFTNQKAVKCHHLLDIVSRSPSDHPTGAKCGSRHSSEQGANGFVQHMAVPIGLESKSETRAQVSPFFLPPDCFSPLVQSLSLDTSKTCPIHVFPWALPPPLLPFHLSDAQYWSKPAPFFRT